MIDRPPELWTLPSRLQCANRRVEFECISAEQARDFADGRPVRIQFAGPRGIGKTRMAVEFAYSIARDYPDGGLFLDANGSDPRATVPAEDLARQALSQLGVPEIPGPPEDRLAAARREISRRRLVVVIDDVSTLEQVDRLLGDTTRSAIIVTGRSRLDALGLRLQFSRISLEPFDDAATGELISAIAGSGRAPVAPALVSAVRAKCAGLPLALAIVAGRITSGEDDPEEFVARLELPDLEVDGEISMSAVYDAVYDALPEEEQQDYRTLCLAPGPDFGLAMAAELLGGSEREARRRVDRLARKFLLEERAGRYHYHGLIREHAAGIAWSASRATAEKHLTSAVRWLVRRAVALDAAYAPRPVPKGSESFYETTVPAYVGPDAAEKAAAELSVEWPNFLAAARSCPDAGLDELLPVPAGALWTFAYQTRRAELLVDVGRRALDLATSVPVRWQLCRDLAGLYERLGDGELTVKFARSALDTGYRPGAASAHEWGGLGYELLGRFAEAKASFAQAIELLPLMDDPVHEERAAALCRMHLSRVAVKEGLVDEAKIELTRARTYFAASPRDASNAARCDGLLGDIAYRQQDARAAEAQWSRARDAYLRLAMPDAAASELDKLAALAVEEAREADAQAYRAHAEGLRQS